MRRHLFLVALFFAASVAGSGAGADAPPAVLESEKDRFDQPPEAISLPRPQYPFEMLRKGIEADVVVEFTVDVEGRVRNSQVVGTSRREFHRAALAAVDKAKFKPAMKAGRPVAVRMQAPLTFRVGSQSGEGGKRSEAVIDPKSPRSRASVTRPQMVRPAITAENKFGTANIAPVGRDPKWNQFGAYMQRLIETVQFEWQRVLVGKSYPPADTTVTVKFVLDSQGRVARILEVKNTSTDSGAGACVSAITNRSPYGPWSDEMKAVLGEQQELTFSFYYQ
jgi:TonB family protein